MEGYVKGIQGSSVPKISQQVNSVKNGAKSKVKEEEISKNQESGKSEASAENRQNSLHTMGTVVDSIHQRISQRIQQSLKENDYFVTAEFREMREHLESLLEKSGIDPEQFFAIGMNMQWEVQADQGEEDFKFFMDVSYQVIKQGSASLSQSYLDGAQSVVELQDRDLFHNFLETNFVSLDKDYSLEAIASFNNNVSKNPEVLREAGNVDELVELVKIDKIN